MIREGDNLQTDFIEEFNSIIARELRSIKQQGMEAALRQSIAMCDKRNLTMG